MEKNCTLVKTLKEVKGKDGITRRYWNYHLDFGNGNVVPVQLREYRPSEKLSKEEIARYSEWNKANAIKLSVLALDASK